MMKKIVFSFSILFLISNVQLCSQEKIYKVTTNTSKEAAFYTVKVKNLGERYNFLDIDGKLRTIKSKYIIGIREEIEGMNYFNFTPSGLTDYINIQLSDLSKKELFNYAIEWVKKTYYICENGYGIEVGQSQDLKSMEDFQLNYDNLLQLKEIQYRIKTKTDKEPFYATKVKDLGERVNFLDVNGNLKTIKAENIMSVRERKRENINRISVDTTNYIIRLFGYRGSDKGYSLDITFSDGEYKFDPDKMVILVDLQNDDSLFEILFLKQEEWRSIPILIKNSNIYYNRKGIVRREFRYMFHMIEDLFNNLNMSLYNHILDIKKEGIID